MNWCTREGVQLYLPYGQPVPLNSPRPLSVRPSQQLLTSIYFKRFYKQAKKTRFYVHFFPCCLHRKCQFTWLPRPLRPLCPSSRACKVWKLLGRLIERVKRVSGREGDKPRQRSARAFFAVHPLSTVQAPPSYSWYPLCLPGPVSGWGA